MSPFEQYAADQRTHLIDTNYKNILMYEKTNTVKSMAAPVPTHL
jgi:hypothetical protein